MKRLYINGKWENGTSSGSVEILNPATEEVLDVVPVGTPGDADKAVEAVR